MHCKHLGTDAYGFGSVLKFLTDYILDRSPHVNLQTIWEYILLEPPVSFSYLKYSMFDNGNKFPNLKGKAHHIRHFGPNLLRACKHFLTEADLTHRLIMKFIKASIDMETLLDQHKDAFVLATEHAETFTKLTYKYLHFLNALRTEFGDRAALFHITPKCHYLVHIALDSLYLNPRLGWCYMGEDFIGKFKMLVASQQVATSHMDVENKVAMKYLSGLDFELRDRVTM